MKKQKTNNEINILLWIFILTFLAGAINVYTIKKFGVTTSHHTGNASNIAIKFCEGNFAVHRLAMLVVCFFAGSSISGFLFHKKNMQDKIPYVISLIFMGSMLMMLEILNCGSGTVYFLAFFIGLQNGMHIKYKGITVRTSHITGYLTDGGFSFGTFLKGDTKALGKTVFFSISILVFIMGGITSYLAIDTFQNPLIIYGVLYVISGVYYAVSVN
ncbi:MAG: YoaK family protein [Peptoniphilus sp.]|nr:YoaK family protein [Peptoniphilus sp.]